MKLADVFIKYNADTKGLDDAVKGLPGKAEPTARKLGDTFQTKLKVGITAGAAAAGGIFAGATESAANFEQQMATVNTITHLSQTQLKALGGDVQALSRETGRSTDDLSSGLYDLVSAGVPADKAINVLRDSAKLAGAALSTTGEAVNLTTSILNAYGLQATESTRVTDIFAKAVADGKVTAAEIANSIGQIAPTASAAGVSMEEVSAAYAIMTAQGVPAAEVATKMRAGIAALLNPNEQLNRIQQQTGHNFANIAREEGLAVALETLRKDTAATGDVMAKLAGVSAKDLPAALKAQQKALGLSNTDLEKYQAMAGKDGVQKTLAAMAVQVGDGNSAFVKSLGSIEAYQFALASGGENADKFAGEVKSMGNASGTVDGQLKELGGTSVTQGKKIAAFVNTAMQKVGEVGAPIAPALLAINQIGPAGVKAGSLIATGMGGAIGWFADTGVKAGIHAAKTSAAWVASAAKSAAAYISLGATLVAEFVKWVARSVVSAASTAASWVASAATATASWVASRVAMLAGFAIAVAGAVASYVAIGAAAVASALIAAAAWLLPLLPFILIAAAVIGLVALIVLNWQTIYNFIAGIVQKIIDQYALAISQVLGFFTAIATKVGETVAAVVAFFVDLQHKISDRIRDTVAGVVDFFTSLPGKIADVGGRIVDGIIGGLTGLPGRLSDAVLGAFRGLNVDIGPFHISARGVRIDLPGGQTVSSYATGITRVPSDMLAFIHQDEMVVDAYSSRAVRSGQAVLGATVGASGGRGGISFRDVNVYQPRTELDIVRALETERHLAKLGARGLRPAPSPA